MSESSQEATPASPRDYRLVDVELLQDALMLIKGREADVEERLRLVIAHGIGRNDLIEVNRKDLLDELGLNSVDLGTYDEPGPSTRP